MLRNSPVKIFSTSKHGFHLVNYSPWPILCALVCLSLTVSGAFYIHGYSCGKLFLSSCFLLLGYLLTCWWRDVIREGAFEGQHTLIVQTGLKVGMLLFIVSEIMFFFAFFWAFFHSSFNASLVVGAVWPPFFLTSLNPWKIPLFNTVLLLSSGATITLTHNVLVLGSKKRSVLALSFTLLLAFIFTGLQFVEYVTCPFSISDSVYGSIFFLITGFHGFHVVIGSVFLCLCLFRLMYNHFTQEHHFGFEAAAWYWHFVDVVWLFLFITIYWWGF